MYSQVEKLPSYRPRKCAFRSRGVAKVKNMFPMLRGKRICFLLACSVRIAFCNFDTPLR